MPGIQKKTESSNIVLQQLDMDVIFHNHGSPTHIYTYGSTYASSSRAALAVPSDGISRSFRLDHKTSSAAAELVAIYKAVE